MKNAFKYIGAWASQVGGSHYHKQGKIQPSHFSMANGHNTLQGKAVKYIDRYKDKNGIIDLDKGIHCLQLLKAWEEGKVFNIDKEIEKVESKPLSINKSCTNCQQGHLKFSKMCNECGNDYKNFTSKY